MATAVVTGATSGIGKALCEMLLTQGYKVYAIGRDLSKISYQGAFNAITCELSDIDAVEKVFEELAKTPIDLLINSAGFGRFDPLESMKPRDIKRLIDVNLQAPIIITNILLETLKRNEGTIINISSIEAVRSSKFSSVYTATKAGLRGFGLALFEEVRRSGVKVVTLNLDMTLTPFFNELRFEPHSDENASLLPENIAQTVSDILELPKNSVVTEMTLRPQMVKVEKKRL